ncbi:hypothetical protein QOZ80_3AG0252160 [Eleusine coracana subsp. coracana]|nr:hypothetical protein QOZ80_3AG0252160 [Eleusine coracana subsp. coracana]
MPLLSGLDPVAAVAQIAGLDAHGLIALIVRRAETVRRNKYECGQLAQQVEAIGGLLRQVQRDHPAMDGSLGKLEATLREACVLVSLCQGAGYLRRILRSGSHAEQFRRVRNRIEFYLQLFPVISHIDTTRRLVRILNGIQPPQTQTQNVIPSSSSTATVGAFHSIMDLNFDALAFGWFEEGLKKMLW